MNHADIVVASIVNGTCNVDDYFNDSNFEGQPKLDTDLGGRNDVLSHSCSFQTGLSEATFSRKISTGDSKDWPVDKGFQHIIIAHGRSTR